MRAARRGEQEALERRPPFHARISNRARGLRTRVRGKNAGVSDYFLRRFRRSRRFLEPIFLLRLGLAMNTSGLPLLFRWPGSDRRPDPSNAVYAISQALSRANSKKPRGDNAHAYPLNSVD